MRIKKILALVTVILVVSSITLGLFNWQSANATKPNQKLIHPTGVDLSKPIKLVIYMVGNKPDDLEMVLKEANGKYFKPKLNTTIEVRFIPFADLQNKYSLILAGGEQCDIIYTANWCYYAQEAAKGAFRELTMNWIKKYMPQTYKSQDPASWEQMMINGKIYAVPKNSSPPVNYKFVVIREDLREKYKLPKITNVATYEKYLFTVAQKEKGIQALGVAGNNWELRQVLCKQLNKIWNIDESYDFYYKMNNKPDAPASSEIFYLFTSPYFKEYVKRMVTWAAKGVWPKNAINNTISPSDLFAQGRAASYVHNFAVFGSGKRLEEAKLGKAGYYDLTPDIKFKRASFANDAFAITRKCQYPERAALVLDMMKNDKNLNLLLIGGIKGVHWIEKPGNLYARGPRADKYSWNTWGWALTRPDLPQDAEASAVQRAMEKSIGARAIPTQTDGFVFDERPVKAELAVINSLRDEYVPALELGMFGNKTDEKLKEFEQKLKKAGLEKVLKEVRRQFDEYKKRKGLK
ncbi:ABC transporter substrate-binding protein [Anaerocellum diazotrophicum]|uniref:ABC transporter substrate-binding protein n=1 Tax=Caldicellulosiruptor diazotrophicus TaxID=2806205 RepID=A0ABM7NPT1_9FIRM|nr:ABC transporter substrate-binding protein [Caldicellulosiruptor diazotrophicus]BCS82086.1 ABC transporter substrate-binding protein [Caldicellulosiruptor diazotrophicus]